MSEQTQLTPEFYPIDRVLIIGSFIDCLPLADKARAAGHTPAMLLPLEEVADVKEQTKIRVLTAEEGIKEDEFDLVIELHCTDLEAKADSLFWLEDSLNEEIPILTLTLANACGDLARDLLMPERVLGISMLPPFANSSLVELMANPHTNDATLHTAKRFFESIDLKPVDVADSPGGVLARTVCCLVNEAAHALQEEIAPTADIDTAMKFGVNYPDGPLAWGDKIGLDRVEAVMDGLYGWFREERYRTTPLLKKLVRAGFIGESVGRGFYQY